MTDAPTHPFKDDPARQRFEREEQGQIAFADYRRDAGRLAILHVEAPVVLRGTGAAGRLMQDIASLAQREGLKIDPYCGYAAAWLRRHKQFAGLVD